LSGLENLVKPALRAEIGRKKEMLIVSEQTERKKRKQKESANAIERGNGPGVVKRNEAVTTAVAVLGTENGNAIAEGRIVIMTAEVAEGKLCAMLIIQFANVWWHLWLFIIPSHYALLITNAILDAQITVALKRTFKG
jgi:hypothetical protein